MKRLRCRPFRIPRVVAAVFVTAWWSGSGGAAGGKCEGDRANAGRGPGPADQAMLARVFPSIVRIEAIRLRPNDGRLTKEWSGRQRRESFRRKGTC
jgi:hypothetical protein